MNKTLAVTFGYWGRGDTLAEAISNCRKAGGKGSRFLIYEGSEDISVDGVGYVTGETVERKGFFNTRKGKFETEVISN